MRGVEVESFVPREKYLAEMHQLIDDAAESGTLETVRDLHAELSRMDSLELDPMVAPDPSLISR